MAEGAGRTAGLGDADFRLDPPLDEPTSRRLVEIWVDVSNAGGAVGFPPPPPEVTIEDVAPVAEKAFRSIREGSDHIVVAYLRNSAVGFAFLEHRPGPLFRHWATIKRLQIAPSFQQRGYGQQLLLACHELARSIGLEQLHLTVRGGTGTEAFYEAHGYRLIARIPDAIRVSPADTREELYMVVRL